MLNGLKTNNVKARNFFNQKSETKMEKKINKKRYFRGNNNENI